MTREGTLDWLRRYESRNVTWLPQDEGWPIVWERARGMRVRDAAGKSYLDFTAAFGVAGAGHAPPEVVRAGQLQMETLLHAMGDVHPHAGKARLARQLSRLTFERWECGEGKTVFCNSGFEAVEAAMKSACQLTGRDRIVVFRDAYHGLGYGALVATDRDHFRGCFGAQVGNFAHPIDFPDCREEFAESAEALGAALATGQFGGVLTEPIQGRGGMKVPPLGFLALLREQCDRYGAALILDEIYTGFGRTGNWFACDHEAVVPDFLCVGKALTGGFPLSACVGKQQAMDAAWPPSEGEAIHTSTFLGHPVGCAMALAQLELLERDRLPERSASQGDYFRRLLHKTFAPARERVRVRGRGLMIGVECRDPSGGPETRRVGSLVRSLLSEGYIVLPDGEFGNVIGLTPPLVVTREEIEAFTAVLGRLYFEGGDQ